jgi:hypothetical protein
MLSVFGTLTTFMAIFTSVSADCTREGLAAANSYIMAQTSGKLDSLKLDANNFTYQENNKLIDIKTGVISQSLNIDMNHSTADTTACASYTMLVSTKGTKLYVLATQIRHTNNNTSSIVMIDTIVTSTGSLFFKHHSPSVYSRKRIGLRLRRRHRVGNLLRRLGIRISICGLMRRLLT